MRDYASAFSGPPWRNDAPNPHPHAEPAAGSPTHRFERALATGNPRLVRAAAAQLPDIGITEAAAILLVIEQTQPDNYDRAALPWLATVATEVAPVDLPAIPPLADALTQSPQPPTARADLARLCTHAGL